MLRSLFCFGTYPEGRFVESSIRSLFHFILLCVGLTTVRLLRHFVSSLFHSMLSFFTTFICTWDMDMSTSTTNTKAYRDISLLMISVSQSGYKQIVNRRSVMNWPDAFLLYNVRFHLTITRNTNSSEVPTLRFKSRFRV